MIVKCGLAALGLLCLSASEPVPQQQYPLVHLVKCDRGSGTAFRVGRTKLLSVSHVTGMDGCKINGTPVYSANEAGDFSVLEYPVPKLGALKINCEGFKAGEYYWAIGHGKGLPTQTTVRLIATGQRGYEGFAVLWGDPTVVPGMSGGPVLNAAGEVVGTVNMFNRYLPLSLSRPLSDTSVCSGSTGAR